MKESVQSRKNPVTTIGINQEVAVRLDNLLQETFNGMSRKEFVESCVRYFERTGFDMTSELADFSQVQAVTMQLAAVVKELKETVQLRRNAADDEFSEYKLKAYILDDKLDVAEGQLVNKQAEIDELKKMNEKLKVDNIELKHVAKMAMDDLVRCFNSGIVPSRPSKGIIDALKRELG